MCNLVEVKSCYFVIPCLNEIIHCSQLLCICLQPIPLFLVVQIQSITERKHNANVLQTEKCIYTYVILVLSKCFNFFFLFSEPVLADMCV